MKKHGLLTRAAAVAALSAAIAMPAVAGLTAGTASAVPREINCIGVWQVMSDSVDMATAAYEQGDQRGYNDWMRQYNMASTNYDRYCLG